MSDLPLGAYIDGVSPPSTLTKQKLIRTSLRARKCQLSKVQNLLNKSLTHKQNRLVHKRIKYLTNAINTGKNINASNKTSKTSTSLYVGVAPGLITKPYKSHINALKARNKMLEDNNE